MHICRHIPKPCYLATLVSRWVGSGSTMHAPRTTSPPPPPSPSRYHATIRHPLFSIFFLLSFPSLLYVMGAEIRNAGPTLPVDVSMINMPLTRTRNYYIYNCAGNWAHIYLVLDKRTGSRNKVTIVELGSVNLSHVFYEEWTTGQPGPPNWSKRSCGAN